MPLVPCPTCEARVSALAQTCPRCGAPLRAARPGMTTGGDAVWLVFALILGVPLGLWAAYSAAGWGASEGWSAGWGILGLLAPIGLALLWSHRAR